MVHDRNDNEFEDVEVTAEPIPDDAPELSDVEENSKGKIRKLQDKLKDAEEAKRAALEDLQRTKADFLNAKRRLEEERVRSTERATMQFIERLLPLYDSFHVAMADEETWTAVDEKWRKGVEGIHAQLQSILRQYAVTPVDPVGQPFDPAQHEAMGEVPVDDPAQHHTVVAVVQLGFTIAHGEKIELLRPARVMVGAAAP